MLQIIENKKMLGIIYLYITTT